jgi:hypothetical protein
LQINRKADPIASWAVVANVEPIVGIRCSKSLEKTNKQKKKKILAQNSENVIEIPYGRRLEVGHCTTDEISFRPYHLGVMINNIR